MADPGENNGQVWKESTSEGQEGYGGTQERDLEKRKVKEEGHEPETGDRDRAFRGAPCGRKGAQKESVFQKEDVVQKESLYEEKIRIPEEEVVQRLTTQRRCVLARLSRDQPPIELGRAVVAQFVSACQRSERKIELAAKKARTSRR